MTEHRNRPHKPTLDDYRAMMSETHAPNQLKQDVLAAAHARCSSASSRTTDVRPSVRAAASSKRTRIKSFAVAACVTLLAGTAVCGLAIGLPGIASLSNDGDNAFFLTAYATEGSSAQPGAQTILSADEFRGTGGYSGAWYDPDSGQFAAGDEWAGFKYSFNLECSGRNIKSIAYEIEGDRAFFETIDGPSSKNEAEAEHTSVFHYSKSIAFDYNDQNHGFGNFSTNQQEGKDDYVVSIYLGFPVPELARNIVYEIMNGTAADSAFYEKEASIDLAAAHALADCKLHLTATFMDGTTQTKTYVITPVDDIEQRLAAFWNASYEASVADRQHEQNDDMPPGERPESPALFTLTELVEE